ncbi:phospholipase D-like domain-containing protein [Oceanithermus sp.]
MRQKPKPSWLGYLLLLALALLALWQQKSGYTNPPPAGEVEVAVSFLPEEEESVLGSLRGSLEGAKRSVDLALLELNDTRLGYALAKTAARGVRVRLFSERDHRGETLATLLAGSRGQKSGRPRVSESEATAAAQPLNGHCERIARVEVCYDDRPGLMHDKFAVIDDGLVFTGSLNWSYNGLHKNDNDLLRLTGKPAARLYHDAFNALWQRKGRAPAPAELQIAGGGRVDVYFTPSSGRQAEQRIVGELDRAEKEIWVAAFVLTNPEIISALNRAAGRGVKVRVLLERRNLQDSREEKLSGAVEVRPDANPFSMHLKTMVIDDRVVITGSFNFTRSAVSRNDENLLVLTSPQLARRYKGKVWELWQAAGRR